MTTAYGVFNRIDGISSSCNHVKMAQGKCKCGNRLKGKSRQCVECKRSYMKRWRAVHPLKVTAEIKLRQQCRSTTHYLIKRGILVKEPCEVCGALKVEAHHEDYRKPFEVRWLCKWDHTQVGLGNIVLPPKEHPAPAYELKSRAQAMTRQELSEFAEALRKLTPKQKLYRVLKEELTALGWWKNRSRGRHKKKRV